MKAFISDAYTADEYLAMGTRHVLLFGLMLVSWGELVDYVMSPQYYPYHEPRLAITI